MNSTSASFTYENQLGAGITYEKEHSVNADQNLKFDSLDNSKICVPTLDQPGSTHLSKKNSKTHQKIPLIMHWQKFHHIMSSH